MLIIVRGEAIVTLKVVVEQRGHSDVDDSKGRGGQGH